jgi:hypothetical protein
MDRLYVSAFMVSNIRILKNIMKSILNWNNAAIFVITNCDL